MTDDFLDLSDQNVRFISSIDRFEHEMVEWPMDDMPRVYFYEPMPPRVTYEAARDRFVYTPENVVPGTMTTSPSDCVKFYC